MDYMMPEMDGLETCRAIVNNPAIASIPVIMTTSNDTPEFRKRGVASGASGFLSKGLEDRELDNVLDSAADRRPELEKTGGTTMQTGRVELTEQTLSMIRDQAMNAARRASEEYFTGQLPGLEEQVIQVAETAARRVMAGQSAGGNPADGDALLSMQERVDNLHNDTQLRAVIAKMVREERSTTSGRANSRTRSDVEKSAAKQKRSGSGIGRFIRNSLVLLLLLIIAYAVIVLGYPETELARTLVDILGPLFQRLGGAGLSG
ncbi:MAG: hypothetical protein DHS20C01_13690 [marine bacterium B5-7]|nr:MAG: hypothetical protein DHS20C01_13690 [marine bacterium B5-7]